MTATQLKKLTTEYQKRLRLQDWKVTPSFVDFLAEFGVTTGSSYAKEATIDICSAHTIPPSWFGCRDLEVTLCHELLHLHAKGFDNCIDRETREHVALETFIEQTAQAIVAAKRGLIVLP